jgi:hypothetical protein
MARFRASVLGNKGETSRLGGQQSGITTIAAGWNTAVKVVARTITLPDENGKPVLRDLFEVFMVNVKTSKDTALVDVQEDGEIGDAPRVIYYDD